MLAKYFSIIRNYVLAFFRKESTLFATTGRFSILLERILATLLAGILRW